MPAGHVPVLLTTHVGLAGAAHCEHYDTTVTEPAHERHEVLRREGRVREDEHLARTAAAKP